MFVPLGHAQAKALGVPALPIVAIDHPFGVRSRDEVRAMAEKAVDDVAKVMSGGGAT